MDVWRINLKPGAQAGIDAREHCLTNGVVGVGWQIDYENGVITGEYYQTLAQEEYGDTSWWPAWNALYNKMDIGDLVWTRDWDGIYYLARITSEWLYDTSENAAAADIVNVRKCDWVKVGTAEAVPGKLVNCFIPARTLQKVQDDTVLTFSMITYNQKTNSSQYPIPKLAGMDIYSLLSSEDCEDALGLYLQYTQDYMIIPSTCKSHSIAYEYELIHRYSCQKAVVQVKNGYNSLNADDYSNLDEIVYLFTTKGNYLGACNEKVRFIDPEIIRQFLFKKTDLLPEKMRTWVNLFRS